MLNPGRACAKRFFARRKNPLYRKFSFNQVNFYAKKIADSSQPQIERDLRRRLTVKPEIIESKSKVSESNPPGNRLQKARFQPFD